MSAGLDDAARRRGHRHRRRPAGPAGTRFRTWCARGARLRRRADAAPAARGRKLAQEGDGARVLSRDGPHRARSTSRRTSAISGCCRARAVEALRRFPERSRFMKGLFAWIGFPSTGTRIRPRRTPRRRDQVELLAAVELRARRHHVVLRRAAQDRELHGLSRRAGRVRARRLRHRQDAALRRPGRRLPDAGRADPVPRRAAADGARRHRRIPGPHVHRSEAAPALPRPAMPRARATDRAPADAAGALPAAPAIADAGPWPSR